MWLAIAALILVGVVLIIVEVVFIPGTTIVGLLGLIFTIIGVVVSYKEFGSEGGSYVLLGAGLALGGAMYYSFRKKAWKKFSLQTSIDSRVNEDVHTFLTTGMEGVAVSALRPMGTAEFEGKMVEVKTSGDYLAAGTTVKVVYVKPNDILVEPIT
ncbi:MAG: hypothetical protein KF845_04675 [Cyclobacteriaceae bacterium]|nr:hypothetical protein [Cyclobacteriaceae bacterium]